MYIILFYFIYICYRSTKLPTLIFDLFGH